MVAIRLLSLIYFSFRSAYILKIVIAVFGMEMDATVNLIGASGQLHDDNRTVFACQFLYLFCRSNTGYHRQPFFLAGNVESRTVRRRQ